MANVKSPGVGVSAVVVEGARVLLVRRANAPAAGCWSFPGGRLELGESLPDGVRREVSEECGIEIDVGPLLDVIEVVRREDDVTHHWIVLDYLAVRRGGRLAAADDADDARWFTLAEIDCLSTTPRVAEVAARAIAARSAWPGSAIGQSASGSSAP